MTTKNTTSNSPKNVKPTNSPNTGSNDSDTFSLVDAANTNKDNATVSTPTTPVATPKTDKPAAPVAPTTPTVNGPATSPAPTAAPATPTVPASTSPVRTNPKSGGKKSGGKKSGGKGKAAAPAADAPKGENRYQKVGSTPPSGRETTLSPKEITLDRRCQQRTDISDDATVERYKLTYQETPEVMPAVQVVKISEAEQAKLKLASCYICFNGFQRTLAARAAKIDTIKATVVDGTFFDAVAYSLASNSANGLQRSHADLRRAFATIFGNDELREAALAKSTELGGATRALARAAGISHGLANNIMRQMGKTVRNGKVVDLPKRNNDESAAAPHTRSEGDPAAAMRVESKEALKARVSAALIKEMCFSAAAIQRRYETLLDRTDAAPILREVAQKNGVPFSRHEKGRIDDPNGTGRDSNNNPLPAPVVVEFWPAVDSLLKTLEKLQEEFTKLQTKPNQ